MMRNRITGLLIAWTLAAAQLAAVSTPPINLGATDLDLELRLWLYDGSTWEAASVGDLTVEDLATGEYTVLGLPTATGSERYSLHIATEADPDVALASYSYGATPGQRIVWRQELVLPSQPTTFKVGDSYGAVQLQVVRRLPAAACEAETTLTFALYSLATGAAIFSEREAEISDCELDSTTSTYGALLTYDLESGDTATAGEFLGEFRICYSPTSCHTLPADNRLAVTITPAWGVP